MHRLLGACGGTPFCFVAFGEFLDAPGFFLLSLMILKLNNCKFTIYFLDENTLSLYYSKKNATVVAATTFAAATAIAAAGSCGGSSSNK